MPWPTGKEGKEGKVCSLVAGKCAIVLPGMISFQVFEKISEARAFTFPTFPFSKRQPISEQVRLARVSLIPDQTVTKPIGGCP